MKRVKLFTAVILLFVVVTPIILSKLNLNGNMMLGLYAWLAGIDGTIGLANQDQQYLKPQQVIC